MPAKSRDLVILFAAMVNLSACGGGGGSESPSPSPPPPPPPAPTVTLSSNTVSVDETAEASLTWSSTNASQCTATKGWNGIKASAGTESVAPSANPTIFEITCTGTGGSATASTQVAVNWPSNPVAGSEGDTTLLGSDLNDNKLRDDVEAFIAARYPNPSERSVVSHWATTATEEMLATDTIAFVNASTREDAAEVCLANLFGAARADNERIEVLAAVLNNRDRFRTYMNNETSFERAIIDHVEAIQCDIDGAVYNDKR